MKTIILFPDTNLFLHCHVLDQLPWATFDADRILLMIGAAVLDEIDKLKNDGNSRRAARARVASALFCRALEVSPPSLTIRDRAPRVILEFSSPLPVDRSTPPTLDPHRADDSLIEEAMLLRADPDTSVMIATSDTGMRVRAGRHRVATFSIPDPWKLPPEGDERDKRIRVLETRLATLEQREPALTIAVVDGSRKPLGSLSSEILVYGPLANEQLEALMSRVAGQFPRVTESPQPPTPSPAEPRGLLGLRIGLTPTKEEIDDYGRAHEQWLANVRQQFESLHRKLNAKARVLPLRIRLGNAGAVPADELLVEISARGGLKLCVAEDDQIPRTIRSVERMQTEIMLRPPPEAPRENFTSFFEPSPALSTALAFDSRTRDMMEDIRPIHRDRHVFYVREDGSKPSQKFTVECTEFRHGIGPRDLPVWIVIPFDAQPTRAHLYCRVSAKNLTKAVSLRFPVALSYVPRSTYEIAAQWRCEQREAQ